MSWLKTKFSRRLSRSQKASSGAGEKEAVKEEKGFVGGAALTGASANNSITSPSEGSRDAVAMAGKVKQPDSVPVAETSATINPAHEAAEPAFLPLATESEIEDAVDKDERIGRPARRKEDVSPISDEEDKGKDVLENKATKDDEDEEFQEARDNFDEDLAPPPTFPAEKRSSVAREARFTEVID